MTNIAREFHRMVMDSPPECTELDPDYFYADPHDDEEKYGKSERAIAMTACNRCPLKYACLQTALEMDETHGIWGGLIPQEREAYKRRMKEGWLSNRELAAT